jgi:hypothetical protein
MKRRADWPRRLYDAIEAARGRPFAWGSHDCAAFATAVAAELTGEDPVAALRGSYQSAFGAERLMAEYGGLPGLVTHFYGEPVTIHYAGRGDLVLAERDNGPALGVSMGSIAAFAGPDGLAFLNMKMCRLAWRI